MGNNVSASSADAVYGRRRRPPGNEHGSTANNNANSSLAAYNETLQLLAGIRTEPGASKTSEESHVEVLDDETIDKVRAFRTRVELNGQDAGAAAASAASVADAVNTATSTRHTEKNHDKILPKAVVAKTTALASLNDLSGFKMVFPPDFRSSTRKKRKPTTAKGTPTSTGAFLGRKGNKKQSEIEKKQQKQMQETTTIEPSQSECPPINTVAAASSLAKRSKPDSPLRSADVICSRAKGTNDHPGNVTFRRLVREHGRDYQATRNRAQKKYITNVVTGLVHQSGGRFVSDSFVEISAEATYEKVSHALRSAGRPCAGAIAKAKVAQVVQHKLAASKKAKTAQGVQRKFVASKKAKTAQVVQHKIAQVVDRKIARAVQHQFLYPQMVMQAGQQTATQTRSRSTLLAPDNDAPQESPRSDPPSRARILSHESCKQGKDILAMAGFDTSRHDKDIHSRSVFDYSAANSRSSKSQPAMQTPVQTIDQPATYPCMQGPARPCVEAPDQTIKQPNKHPFMQKPVQVTMQPAQLMQSTTRPIMKRADYAPAIPPTRLLNAAHLLTWPAHRTKQPVNSPTVARTSKVVTPEDTTTPVATELLPDPLGNPRAPISTELLLQHLENPKVQGAKALAESALKHLIRDKGAAKGDIADNSDSRLRECDVICARSRSAAQQPGNKIFVRLVRRYGDAYQKTKVRSEKKDVVFTVIKAVYATGGRFVDSQFKEVSEEFLYEKVSHALRSANSSRAKNTARSASFNYGVYAADDKHNKALLAAQDKYNKAVLGAIFKTAPLDSCTVGKATTLQQHAHCH